MKNSLKTELAPLARELHRVWNEIYPDAGPCTTAEIGELVMDRLPEPTITAVRTLIDAYGWVPVRYAVGNLVRN
jgi:hypothetical protein